jgi:hypothetical protein
MLVIMSLFELALSDGLTTRILKHVDVIPGFKRPVGDYLAHSEDLNAQATNTRVHEGSPLL